MFKSEFNRTTQQGNYHIEIDFNYYCACYVIVKCLTTGVSVCWSQYENCIYFGTNDLENESLEQALTVTEHLIPNPKEIEQKLKMFPLPQQFPVDILLENIKQVSKDIENNYPVYWEQWRKQHSQNK